MLLGRYDCAQSLPAAVQSAVSIFEEWRAPWKETRLLRRRPLFGASICLVELRTR